VDGWRDRSAKQRLTTILQTLRGELTWPEVVPAGDLEAPFQRLRSACFRRP